LLIFRNHPSHCRGRLHAPTELFPVLAGSTCRPLRPSILKRL